MTTIKFKLELKNTIHARTAFIISDFLSNLNCDVFIKKGDEIVNCKNAISILKLFLKNDDEIELLVDGDEEKRNIILIKNYLNEF